MAVPKRKTPRVARTRGARQTALEMPSRSLCPQCGAAKLPHRVCGNCGTYRGRQVIDVN